MLSKVAVRNAKARGKDYKLADSEGLYLFVTKAGQGNEFVFAITLLAAQPLELL